MLKFFRKIRQQLLNSGQMKKYSLYAIGEILLVMIGILLALQVNNWNEERKNKKVERNLYQNLLTNLEGDSTDLVRVIRLVNLGINANRIFIENSYENLIANYHIDTLEKFVSQINAIGRSFFPRYGAYDQITNNGFLPLLKSEQVKNKLVELYERSYKLYEHVDAVVEQKNQFYLHPITSGELQVFHPNSKLEIPEGFNQQKLKQHFDELTKRCRGSYVIANSSRIILNNIQKKVSTLQQLIREELK